MQEGGRNNLIVDLNKDELKHLNQLEKACLKNNVNDVENILDYYSGELHRLDEYSLKKTIAGVLNTATFGWINTDPASNNSKALRLASTRGYIEIVQELLLDGRSDPAANNNEAIKNASINGYPQTVLQLLQHPNVDPNQPILELLKIMKQERNQLGINYLIQEFSLLRLIDDRRFNPNYRDNSLANSRFRFLENSLTAIILASSFSLSLVRLLITKGANPTDQNNAAIRTACIHGKLEIVRFLLELRLPQRFGVIDVTAEHNEAIVKSSGHGYIEIVQLLLAHGADPTDQNNESIRLASKFGKFHVVELLLAHGVDPSANHNEAFRLACKNGYFRIVKILLNDIRVNPEDNHNEAIQSASENGHLFIVNLLLKHGINAYEYAINNAIKKAKTNKHEDIVLLLEKYKLDKENELKSKGSKKRTIKHVKRSKQRSKQGTHFHRLSVRKVK
jgi:ankyrin repeat protein